MDFSFIHLRPYQPSDFETLYRIDQICFPANIAYSRAEMNYYLRTPGYYCVLAQLYGDVAGFILTLRSPDLVHVITLDVLEGYRRRGVGSLLLEEAEREASAQGMHRIYLETETTNRAAIAMWKKHGYRESVTIGNYYGQGHDAFEMHKLLNNTSGAH